MRWLNWTVGEGSICHRGRSRRRRLDNARHWDCGAGPVRGLCTVTEAPAARMGPSVDLACGRGSGSCGRLRLVEHSRRHQRRRERRERVCVLHLGRLGPRVGDACRIQSGDRSSRNDGAPQGGRADDFTRLLVSTDRPTSARRWIHKRRRLAPLIPLSPWIAISARREKRRLERSPYPPQHYGRRHSDRSRFHDGLRRSRSPGALRASARCCHLEVAAGEASETRSVAGQPSKNERVSGDPADTIGDQAPPAPPPPDRSATLSPPQAAWEPHGEHRHPAPPYPPPLPYPQPYAQPLRTNGYASRRWSSGSCGSGRSAPFSC